jgi:hypothetical protein
MSAPHLITPAPGTCKRCFDDNCYTLRLLDDEPIILCLACCQERVRKRIENELQNAYRMSNLDQLYCEDIGLRLVNVLSRLRMIERLIVNYQKIRRLK